MKYSDSEEQASFFYPLFLFHILTVFAFRIEYSDSEAHCLDQD